MGGNRGARRGSSNVGRQRSDLNLALTNTTAFICFVSSDLNGGYFFCFNRRAPQSLHTKGRLTLLPHPSNLVVRLTEKKRDTQIQTEQVARPLPHHAPGMAVAKD